MATRRIVKQNSSGGWEIRVEGHRRATAQARTQGEAVARARDLARREGGGEIQVHNRTGKIVDAKVVQAPKGRPPSGKRSASSS
jgi:hypothetical protein